MAAVWGVITCLGHSNVVFILAVEGLTERLKEMQPLTEASNALTKDIDIASAAEIVSMLEQCDQEIFNGYENFKSLFHEETLQTISDVASHVAEVLKAPSTGAVIFSGCGTSGRLGFIASRTFNEVQEADGQPLVYDYLIAGGDKALFTSQEAIEDDPLEGAKTLKKVAVGKRKVVYFGITCGLSAPYVAGQLDYCMDHPETFVPVLIGFNPTHLARNIPIEKWEKTFLQVAQRLESFHKEGNGFILNPVVGPEPITGSSRMKSGTATKILLETILMKAYCSSRHTDIRWKVDDHLHTYQEICEAVYRQTDTLKEVVSHAGESLKKGGHIYYLGQDNLALLGLIDASECPPTYGATLDDVRGFVEGGYMTLKNKEGDISHLGRHFRISVSDFAKDVHLSDADVVIIINKGNREEIPEVVAKSSCKRVLITLIKDEKHLPGFDAVFPLDLKLSYITPEDQKFECLRMKLFQEIALKWCLNAISTGAHVLKGKVYKNIMIDVKVSNNKLFHRAVGILEKLGNLTNETAREYLLKSIYETDKLSAEQRDNSISNHITAATPKAKVVPVALMAAVGGVPIEEATLELTKQPVIRTAVVNTLQEKKV